MGRPWLVGIMLVALLLAGCDGNVLVRLDVPIVVEPAPPRYWNEIDGYLFYDSWTEHVEFTYTPNKDPYYRPLVDAKVTIQETGKAVYTDRYGYFHIGNLQGGKYTLVVQHPKIRGRVYVGPVWAR